MKCKCCGTRELVRLPEESAGAKKPGGPVFVCAYCDGDDLEIATDSYTWHPSSDE